MNPARPLIPIPAFREERTIEEVLDRIPPVDLAPPGVERNVIVGDDESDHATAEIAAAAAQRSPSVIVTRDEQALTPDPSIVLVFSDAKGSRRAARAAPSPDVAGGGRVDLT